jgi:hypothetical protein
MRRLVILGILIILISSMLIAGCVFEEEKEKKKDDDDNGDNGNGNGSPVLNITEMSHEPASPTETDDVKVTVKIDADNDIITVTVTFCDVNSGVCNLAGDMILETGTEDTYTYTMPAGTYSSGIEVSYHVIVTDSEGSNEEDERTFTVQ